MNVLYRLERFRACRWFAAHHAHVNGLCWLTPADRDTILNDRSTYRLYCAFHLWTAARRSN